MSISAIITKFIQDFQLSTWQEWVSTISQIISVYFAQKNSVLVYPTGMIGVLLAAWMYYFVADPPLYADTVLNIYYFAMSIYGWYNWSLMKNQTHVFDASYATKNELFIGLSGFVLSWAALFFILKYLTNSNTPTADALVSASAVIAMWWMARRRIENWYAWIFSNLVAIPLNFYKGFMLFTAMYVIFLLMAIYGYLSWKRLIYSSPVTHE
ncbi:MAG: nicotinamide mononucleotide transporter [Lewinellaceae bacterium]|nr:nicotinamide mononucleotide transporter [Lewinellaceae bacterium]